uniref:(California timema) hypothetical protein n=1 Tax=Timema californicum TaxID=61474 RepID=A0A7R9J5F8_TIMCA|nr:unnamed protein product [Timema californicum]
MTSMSRKLAFMPKSPAGMNMTTSVSVSPVSPNYDMHQRVPLSVSGMNMFGNASIPQSHVVVSSWEEDTSIWCISAMWVLVSGPVNSQMPAHGMIKSHEPRTKSDAEPPVPINAVDVEHDTPCEVDDDDNDIIEAQTPHQSR